MSHLALAQPAQRTTSAPPCGLANDNNINAMVARSRSVGASRRRGQKALQMRFMILALRGQRDAMAAVGRPSRRLELALWAAQYRADAWVALSEGDPSQAARLRRTAVAFARSAAELGRGA